MPTRGTGSHQVRAYSLPAGRQASSDPRGICAMKFIGQVRCKDVLAYPLHAASVCRFLFVSTVPIAIGIVVLLPCPTSSFRQASVHASQQTTLLLTNRHYQLACKRFTPSGIIRYLRYLRPCWAHTKCIINGRVQGKFVV